MIEAAERIVRPVAHAGPFVVEEDATVLHGRLAVGVLTGTGIDLGVFLHGHVGPPVPGRDTQLAGKLVDAVDGAALVAAGHDDAVGLHVDDEFLVAAFQLLGIRLLVDEGTFAPRTHDNGGRGGARHGLKVGLEVLHGKGHAAIVGGVELHGGGGARQLQGRSGRTGKEQKIVSRPQGKAAQEKEKKKILFHKTDIFATKLAVFGQRGFCTLYIYFSGVLQKCKQSTRRGQR